MSSPTFHRFNDLPKELQLQIWEKASAAPAWKDAIGADIIWEILQISCTVTGTVRNVYRRFIRTTDSWRNFPARRSLMQTCRWARLVTMKVWRKEVMGVKLDEGEEGNNLMDMQEVQSELGLAFEVEVLKLRWRMGL